MLVPNCSMMRSPMPTILLVDDSEVVRKSASRCLRWRGFVVLEAASANEAYMTGHLGRSARCEIVLDDAETILIKPFTPSKLEERVREALNYAVCTDT